MMDVGLRFRLQLMDRQSDTHSVLPFISTVPTVYVLVKLVSHVTEFNQTMIQRRMCKLSKIVYIGKD